ncbi:MAG TPA: hypothetical protein VFU02_23880 [Polyangiaceae bacterium]|nr:hypothetical protein [Polyangiaceae bacterium]
MTPVAIGKKRGLFLTGKVVSSKQSTGCYAWRISFVEHARR